MTVFDYFLALILRFFDAVPLPPSNVEAEVENDDFTTVVLSWNRPKGEKLIFMKFRMLLNMLNHTKNVV